MEYINKQYQNLKLEKVSEIAMTRRKYDTTLLTELSICPLRQLNSFEMYYVPTLKTMDLIGKITRDDNRLLALYQELPSIAKKSFLLDLIAEEIYSSNKLEGVNISKSDIISTLSEDSNKFQYSQFSNSYNLLSNNELRKPKNVSDIAKIYSKFILSNIDKESLPDGRDFRNDVVFIQKAGKEIHRGVSAGDNTEALIIHKLEELFYFVNKDTLLNPLVKNAIFHYYFGYIHPFYDGNGRTSRFISSLFLLEDFSKLTALSLSQGCYREKSLYWEAFNLTNQVSMQGEINYFIDSFLEIINSSQDSIITELQEKKYLHDIAYEKINGDIRLDSSMRSIVSNINQVYFFAHNQSMSISDIESAVGISKQTVRAKVSQLLDLGLLEMVSKNPLILTINRNYLEN